MKMIKRMISSVAVVLMLASGLMAGDGGKVDLKALQPSVMCASTQDDVFNSLDVLAQVYGDKEAVKMVNRLAYRSAKDNCTLNICGRYPELCCCDKSCRKVETVKMFAPPADAKR